MPYRWYTHRIRRRAGTKDVSAYAAMANETQTQTRVQVQTQMQTQQIREGDSVHNAPTRGRGGGSGEKRGLAALSSSKCLF